MGFPSGTSAAIWAIPTAAAAAAASTGVFQAAKSVSSCLCRHLNRSSLVPLLWLVCMPWGVVAPMPAPIPDGVLAWLFTLVVAAAGASASIQTQGSARQCQHPGLQTQGSGAVPLHQQQAVSASANLQQQPIHLQSTQQAPSEPANPQASAAQQQLPSTQMATSLAASAGPAHTQAAGPPSVMTAVPSTAPSVVPGAPTGAAVPGAVPPAQAAGPLPGTMPSGAAGAQQPGGQPVGPLQPQHPQQHQQQTQGPGETFLKAADWQPASNGNTFHVATILQQQQGMHRPAAPSKGPVVHRNVHGDMARRLALAAAAAATRIRQRQKAESLRRAEEATAVRAEPLGQDRRFNR